MLTGSRIIRTISLAAIAAWLVVGMAVATTQSITLNPGDSVTITAAQGGSGPPPPGTITCPDGSVHTLPYTCPVTPPPGTDTADHCNGFSDTVHLKVDWNNPTRLTAAMNANSIVVYEFTTGSGKSLGNNLPRVAGAEYGGGAANRIGVMSENPCSFDAVGGAVAASVNSSAVTIPFTVQNPYPWLPNYYPDLQFNHTYYVNVKAAPGSGCTTACPMFFDLSKNGTP